MLKIPFSNLLLVFSLFTLVSLLPFPAAAEEKTKGAEDKTIVVTEEQKTTFINIYSWATILPKELIDLQNRIHKENRSKSIEEQLPKLAEEIDALRWDTTAAQTSAELQPLLVDKLQERTQRIGARLNNITESVDRLITFLSENRKQWIERKEKVLNIDETEEIPLILEKDQYRKVLETVDEAIRLIEENLNIVLTTGKQIGDLQITLYSVDSDLQALDTDLKVTYVQQTAPSMLSGDFYSRINIALFTRSFARTKLFIEDHLSNVKQNSGYVFLGCLGLVLLCIGIYKTKDFPPKDSQWQPFAKRPVATAIFMGSSINAITNIFPVNADLQQQWEALLHVITLFAVIRLTKNLMADKEKRRLLKQLSFFLAITMTLFLLGLPQILILLYVFYVSIAAFFYYLSRLPSTRNRKASEVWLQRTWGLFPLLIIVAGVAGYDQLAVMLFSVFLSTIIACLIVWVLYLFHLGVLELVLSLLPFPLIKENLTDILKSVRPIIAWFHLLILVTIQSVIWDIYPTINKAFVEINNLGFDLGGENISLKFIFTIGGVFYGALLASRALQAFLIKDVLPRYKVEKGVQLSITRLAHYGILTIGFLVMLRVLGFQLNQITLLGGALGIGIGFGLQAIVTNFASGLILLFERPLKVGDTIQVGTEWGEVKQLGLRATIIQTFDNAEIVVPNSDLITGQVTNWTLADRKVRVKIPVGVAYGSDISKVMEILISCGNANPMVLNAPKPNVFFLAFGANSLDFELRVWIPEFLDKIQVLSDLNIDIENEFAINNIEIPFPQSDLHLRSVDEGAGAQLRGEVFSKMAPEKR
ncbi:mechanosensitive ion channel domain-containing protein [Desulfopila sp. IMCC35008]|uniref:mechanosensitive ion channel domain-containing protein n=1 Tax=Desulfopila sp. IMCC35008 TaxID=2653858 RepID=UPI0013D1DD35|nr:mechanosensitive ion channel domain-containing protein [Desulfopila sp. IMCC35008]